MANRDATDAALRQIRAGAGFDMRTLAGTRLLVALSGGPDSVALCFCLRVLADQCDLSLRAAHLDHGLRPASSADARFVETLCEAWSIPLTVGNADVAALAAERGGGVEEAARFARYAFLDRAAEETGCTIIALGHHMDDQAETFLLAAARGSGLAGLRGMAAVNGRYWRPFLGLRRRQIAAVIEENKLPCCVDESNASDAFARNRLRKLMPSFEAIHGGAVENIARGMDLLAEDEAALAAWTDRAWKACAPDGRLRVEALWREPAAIRARLVMRLAQNAGLTTGFSRANVEDVLALAGRQSGRRCDLPKGFRARRLQDVLIVERSVSDGILTDAYDLPLAVPGETLTPDGVFRCERAPCPSRFGSGWPTAVEAAPEALQGASVRRRQPGDWIRPLGAPGKKNWKKYCIDKKMPADARALPLIAMGDEVLFSPAGAFSQRLDASGCDEVIRIAFCPMPAQERNT